MNDKIKELKKRATIEEYSHGAFGESEIFYRLNAEKFANLIIQECMFVSKDIELVGIHSEDYEQGVWEGIQMYHNQLQRHFNIK
jgi:hypothetical protein